MRELDRETLAKILQAENIQGVPFPELLRLYREEEGISTYLPDGVYQVDPRNGDRILYHSSRARRPHDNRPAQTVPPEESGQECVICQGRTTGVIDVAELSQGFTFINKNLFPILYPFDRTGSDRQIDVGDHKPRTGEGSAHGLHLLQWTSSLHDRDWHNMPLSDCAIAMDRLAVLEKKLLAESGEFMPVTEKGEHGFVLIVKNYGRLVGGSLAHGHQQIAHSNVMPRHIRDNWVFETEREETFSAYLLRENRSDLIVRDYGPAVLVIPYFMRRPYDMMLLIKDVDKRFLHQLSEAENRAVAQGWQDAIRLIRSVMPQIGREIAYNVITNNGPGAGLYFEFLPYTQEVGGAEHLGLIVCQGNPASAAARIRELLTEETESKP